MGILGKAANYVKKANLKQAAGDYVKLGTGVTQNDMFTGGKASKIFDKTVDKATGNAKGLTAAPSVNAADPAAYQAATDSLLNPVAGQFQDFANNASVTSNVDPAFRQYQLGLAQQLQAQATGQGPSLAQLQLQQATDRTLNQSLGQIRSATGANAGLAARTAALASAQQLGAAGNASGQLRLQEQMQAQQALAGLANQGRSGDLQTGQMATQAQIAQNQARLGGLQGLAGVRGQQVGTAGDIYGNQNQAALGTSQARNKRNDQILGTVLQTGGAIVGGIYGGPAGAAGGATAGKAVGEELEK